MFNKFKNKIFICLIIIFFAMHTLCYSVDLKDLISKQEDAKKQKEEASKQMEEVKNNLSETMYSIEELHQKIIKKEEEIDELNNKIEKLAKKINKTEKNLKEAEEIYSKQKQLSDARLIAIYEAGEIGYLDVLLKSSNLSEFISNFYIISELVKKDTQMLEELENQKNIVETEKKSLDTQKKKILNLRNNNETNSVLLENMIILKNNYMNNLTKEEQEIQEKINTYDEEIKKIDNEIHGLVNDGISYSGGVMLWPTPGYTTITSPFGYRIHPIFGVQRFHSGMDIGVPMNSTVLAANDGVVIKAAYSSSYGNMVMIDHGRWNCYRICSLIRNYFTSWR